MRGSARAASPALNIVFIAVVIGLGTHPQLVELILQQPLLHHDPAEYGEHLVQRHFGTVTGGCQVIARRR